MRIRLLVVIQTFSEMITQGYCYADRDVDNETVWMVDVSFNSAQRKIVWYAR